MSDGLMCATQAAQAAARVMARCDQLAEISETPGFLTRVYLSPEHLRANALVGEWMAAAGMTVWQDSVGNICGRYEGLKPGRPRCYWVPIWIRSGTPDVLTACSAY